MSLFRDSIDALSAYQPGEQPKAGERVIKLNTNENPYPPSPKAVRVLRELDPDALRRYPRPYADAAREAAARLYGVPTDRVLVGNGSDDLLTMVMRSTAEPGRKVAFATPTYVLYRTLARIQAAEVVEVAFDDDYRLPVEALAAAGAAVTLVATPNSPSGTRASNDDLRRLATAVPGLLVIDEAYTDFADDNALPLAQELPNVLVLRTLSKGYSLAGLRVGFGVARPDVIAGLAKVKDSYNVDAVASAVATAAIEDQDWKNANAERVKASRAKLTAGLEELAFRVWPSEANFLLVRPSDGKAGVLYEALKARGILVRYFNQPRLDDKVRITVGTDEQNAALLAVIRETAQERS